MGGPSVQYWARPGVAAVGQLSYPAVPTPDNRFVARRRREDLQELIVQLRGGGQETVSSCLPRLARQIGDPHARFSGHEGLLRAGCCRQRRTPRRRPVGRRRPRLSATKRVRDCVRLRRGESGRQRQTGVAHSSGLDGDARGLAGAEHRQDQIHLLRRHDGDSVASRGRTAPAPAAGDPSRVRRAASRTTPAADRPPDPRPRADGRHPAKPGRTPGHPRRGDGTSSHGRADGWLRP